MDYVKGAVIQLFGGERSVCKEVKEMKACRGMNLEKHVLIIC